MSIKIDECFVHLNDYLNIFIIVIHSWLCYLFYKKICY